MLSRPNGELTRAGQYYYQLIGRPPPSRQYDRNQPLIREGPNDYIMLRGGAKKLLRSPQPNGNYNGNYHLTKLGKSFFKDKWVDWVVHVPVIIQDVRRNGRNRGMPYVRTKRLPVTDLNVALSRQSEGLSDAQAARNLKASVLAQLENPEPNDIILELSDETYYLDATREWTFSQQATQVVGGGGHRPGSAPRGPAGRLLYQLFCGDEILESAFEQRPDKLCVARQLAELMRLPLQEVLSDFDAITGILHLAPSPDVLRALPGPPAGQVRACGQGAAGRDEPPAPSRGASRSGPGPGQIPGREEARRNAGVQGLAGVGGRGGAEGAPGRGALPQGGHAEHERAAPGGAAGLDEPAGAPLSRAAPGGRILHLLKARRDPPSSPQAVLAEQEYQCKLCAAPITAATCELDHIVPVHQSFSAQAQNLQALCLEWHRNKTALEYSHATTLESRFSRRAYEAYVESPRLPPLVFKLNSHKPDHICHGIDVVRCRKNALAHARFPAPIFCPKDNMEQAREGHLADLTYVKLQEDGRWAAFPRSPTWAKAGTPSPRWPTCLKRASRPGTTSRGAWTPRRTWTRSP